MRDSVQAAVKRRLKHWFVRVRVPGDLDGPAWRTPDVFDDDDALLEATSGLGLEGVVAKRRSEPYRPGERGWVKVKHRHYWRFRQELERAQRREPRCAIYGKGQKIPDTRRDGSLARDH